MSKRKLDETDRLEECCNCVLALSGQESINYAIINEKLTADGFSTAELEAAFNHLLSSSSIALFEDKSSGQILVKRQTADEQAQQKVLAGLGDEELLIFARVKEAGVRGVWKKSLKMDTGLKQNPKFEKALKNLQKMALIKRVCTKTGPKNQHYMLANLEPPDDLTGWPWHTEDGRLNSEFIDKLRHCVHQVTRDKTRASLEEMHEYVKVSGIEHSSELTKDHVECITKVLQCDNLIETIPAGLTSARSSQLFRPARLNTESIGTGTMAMPCGVCPVAKQCKVGGLVSPATCEYLDKWLDF